MNIEGVNLSSVLISNSGTQSLSDSNILTENFSNALTGQIALLSEGKSPVELPGQLQNTTVPNGAQPLPDSSILTENFSNTLTGQIALLSERKNPVELPGQLQNTTVPQMAGSLEDVSKSLNYKGDEKASTVSLGNYLSLPYKKNVPVHDDVEASSLTLADVLKAIPANFAQDNVTTTPHLTFTLPDTLKTIASDNKAIASTLNITSPDTLNAITSTSTPDDKIIAANLSFALPDVQKAITPDFSPDEIAIAQNGNAAMLLNGLTFVKPSLEETQSNTLNKGDSVSGDFLQKEILLRQPIQNEQSGHLPSPENTNPVDKTVLLEKQTVLSGIEKTLPDVTIAMPTFHRPIDNKLDNPTLTKPLTHPDWSKDLGEQIVWMNNKTLPAAEIKLNPEHLGPLSVRIDVNKDQATILFTAQHADVKDAIEASIPKLREMLATQQLNLVNVTISHHATSDQGRSNAQAFYKPPENHEQRIENIADTLENTEHERSVVSKGLLSLYV